MRNSLTGGAALRRLAGIALFCLVPLSAAAQDPLTCRAWTDNPVVAGSTPLRAEHINEIRTCLERIISHLGVMPVDPVGSVTMTDLVKVGGEIYATFLNNTADTVEFRVWLRVYDQDDQVLWVYEVPSWWQVVRISGGGRDRVRLLDTSPAWHEERGSAYYTIELTTAQGVPVLCSGCGRFPW